MRYTMGEELLFLFFLNLDCVWHDFLSVLDHKEAAKGPETRLPTTWSSYSYENLEFPWSQLELLILVCYGSDEEQARTVVQDAVEQKCHTHRCCSKMNERERWERTHRIMWFTFDQGYIHGRENKEPLLLLMQYISGSLF